jgi:hypothetical protein
MIDKKWDELITQARKLAQEDANFRKFIEACSKDPKLVEGVLLKPMDVATAEAAVKHLQQQAQFTRQQLEALRHYLTKRWP